MSRLASLKPRVATLNTRQGNKLPGYTPAQKPSQQPGYRIRGRKGQEIRAAHLAREPLCRACMAKGIVQVAHEVDHILPLTAGGEDVEDNKQSLCRPCHEDKSARELKAGYGRDRCCKAER